MTLEISPSFPPEIIREILLKVATVKSLLQCKSVCKEWYTLISDQHFIKSHYAHHRLICNTFGYDQLSLDYNEQRSNLISCPLYDVLFDESVANNAIHLEHPLQPPRILSIVGSCNGLVCLFVEDDDTLCIYNPSTRRTNILPDSKQGAALICLNGFGYDETTHDYKVVRICRCKPTWPYWGTIIYSLKAGSWKEIGCFPCANPCTLNGKFLNGALHWATGDRRSDSGVIVSLDLGKETYGEVLPPEYDSKGNKKWTLGVLGEWLCVLCNYEESCEMDLWVMKVYGVKDSWTKLACIPRPTNIWWDKTLDPLCISNDGKVLLKFGSTLLAYDSKDSSSTMINNFDRCNCIDACIVVESLVSPFPPLGLADNNDDEN